MPSVIDKIMCRKRRDDKRKKKKKKRHRRVGNAEGKTQTTGGLSHLEWGRRALSYLSAIKKER